MKMIQLIQINFKLKRLSLISVMVDSMKEYMFELLDLRNKTEIETQHGTRFRYETRGHRIKIKENLLS